MDSDLILRSFPGLVRDYFGGIVREYGLRMSVSRMGEEVLLYGSRFSLSISSSVHPGEFGSPSLFIHRPGNENLPGYSFRTLREMRDQGYLARSYGRAGTPSSQLLPLFLAESASDLAEEEARKRGDDNPRSLLITE
jgi:hypothetical protein